MAGPILRITDLTVSDGEKVILSDLTTTLGPTGLVAILGPMGSGKSTLLKVIAGHADTKGLTVSPQSLSTTVEATEICLIGQKVRDKKRSTAARCAEISAMVARHHRVICIDEPTAGLSTSSAAAIMADLRVVSQSCLVLLVTHNLAEVRAFADHVLLLAGARLVADLETARFFAAPKGSLARQFVDTSGLDLPSIGAKSNQLSPEHRRIPEGLNLSFRSEGATGGWIIADQLGVDTRPSAAHHVVRFDADRVWITQSGVMHGDMPLQGGYNRPDLDAGTILKMSSMLGGLIRQEACVVIDPTTRPACGAALAAAVLLRSGVGPDQAVEAIRFHFSMLHLGMRLEQMVWDMDLAIAME